MFTKDRDVPLVSVLSFLTRREGLVWGEYREEGAGVESREPDNREQGPLSMIRHDRHGREQGPLSVISV